jgi:hypothetical protein
MSTPKAVNARPDLRTAGRLSDELPPPTDVFDAAMFDEAFGLVLSEAEAAVAAAAPAESNGL